jgi:hypothetical protein
MFTHVILRLCAAASLHYRPNSLVSAHLNRLTTVATEGLFLNFLKQMLFRYPSSKSLLYVSNAASGSIHKNCHLAIVGK